ncbi:MULTISPECIES: glycoside hydrolase family 73 protein [unclassified Brucella]|uniref:glycoside hydrolase family 73 protein n=1 Tax=unclassified Brucella TaxID=2632610 RepID=UPI000309B5D2
MNRRANAGEKAGHESADQAFGGIDFSSLFGGGAAYPSAVAGGASPTSGAATGTTPTTGATVDLSGDKQKFIDTLLPAAIEHGQRIGVDPRIIVAQAAQETGWGKSAPGNNFFGIKSHGQGGGQNLTTHEVINGQRVKINDSFRTFASPQDSVAGYADFIASNKRYRPMREAQGLDAQLQALGASGYATDPNYARSVGAIARSINLPQQAQPQGVQVASLDPSAGLEQAYAPQQQPNNAAAAINMVAPQSPYPEQGQVPPHDFTSNPQLSAGAGMPFQGGQSQPQQMASIQPQQQTDPKAAIRDALLRRNDMMLGGALAPQGQAPQQVADASGAFPPAPTGQPFAGQQGGDARGAMVQKLMQAAQNPWLNDNQRPWSMHCCKSRWSRATRCASFKCRSFSRISRAAVKLRTGRNSMTTGSLISALAKFAIFLRTRTHLQVTLALILNMDWTRTETRFFCSWVKTARLFNRRCQKVSHCRRSLSSLMLVRTLSCLIRSRASLLGKSRRTLQAQHLKGR